MAAVISAEQIVVKLPKGLAQSIASLPKEHAERMRELLDQNSDGTISAAERRELMSLVKIVEFGQIMTLAIEHGVNA